MVRIPCARMYHRLRVTSMAATVNDDSCDFESCLGCLDAAACNFDGEALYNDQSQCVFPAPFLDCDGNCLSDSDGDGI